MAWPRPNTIPSHIDPVPVFGRVYRTRVWHLAWFGETPRGGVIDSPAALAAWRSGRRGRSHRGRMGLPSSALGQTRTTYLSVDGTIRGRPYPVTRRRGVGGPGLVGAAHHGPRRIDGDDGASWTPSSSKALLNSSSCGIRSIVSIGHRIDPRFWMQHRLAQVLTEHALVRRALGMPATDTVAHGAQHWLQTDVALGCAPPVWPWGRGRTCPSKPLRPCSRGSWDGGRPGKGGRSSRPLEDAAGTWGNAQLAHRLLEIPG